jgi:hypothetical protein
MNWPSTSRVLSRGELAAGEPHEEERAHRVGVAQVGKDRGARTGRAAAHTVGRLEPAKELIEIVGPDFLFPSLPSIKI